MASSCVPRTVVRSKVQRRAAPCSAVSQPPSRIPCFFTLFTRRIPVAKSGLSKPASAFSYAKRRGREPQVDS